jgi:hypothetical protein
MAILAFAGVLATSYAAGFTIVIVSDILKK